MVLKQITDSHGHICSQSCQLYGKNLEKEIEKINQLSYLSHFVNVGLDEKSSKEAIYLSKSQPKFYATIGIHPLWNGTVDSFYSIYEQTEDPSKIVAVGETGLDIQKELKEQKEKLIQSIRLANFLQLPLIIHANQTNKEVLELLQHHPVNEGFLMHCYYPELQYVKELIAIGGYFSFGTPITRANAKRSLQVIENVPFERIRLSLYEQLSSRRWEACLSKNYGNQSCF